MLYLNIASDMGTNSWSGLKTFQSWSHFMTGLLMTCLLRNVNTALRGKGHVLYYLWLKITITLPSWNFCDIVLYIFRWRYCYSVYIWWSVQLHLWTNGRFSKQQMAKHFTVWDKKNIGTWIIFALSLMTLGLPSIGKLDKGCIRF